MKFNDEWLIRKLFAAIFILLLVELFLAVGRVVAFWLTGN